MQAPENVAAHFFWIACPIILAQIVIAMVGFFKNREIGKKRDAQNEVLEANFPRHAHGEYKDSDSVGNLKVEGLSFPKRIDRQ